MRKARVRQKLTNFFNEPFVEDVPEPFTGYKKLMVGNFTQDPTSRQFIIDDTLSPYLMSSHDNMVWPVDGAVASCNVEHLDFGLPNMNEHSNNQIPYPRCTCGIYAYKTIHTSLNHLMYERPNVVVELKLGGYVIPYTDGYRAQIAKISKVIMPTGCVNGQDNIDHTEEVKSYEVIAEHYGVDIKTSPVLLPRQSILARLGMRFRANTRFTPSTRGAIWTHTNNTNLAIGTTIKFTRRP